MRVPLLFLVLSVIIPLPAFSQGGKKDFKKFLSYFQESKLPLCEDYESHEELWDSTEIYLSMTLPDDTVIAEEYDTIVRYVPEPRGLVPNDSADALPSAYYDLFLGKEIDSTIRELYYVYEEMKYLVFPLHAVMADSFAAVTVEVQFRPRFSVESKKYLVTYDKKGRLLDMLEIALYEFAGTGIDDYGRRVPWFYTMPGCIDKDWKVVLHDNTYNNPVKWYQVTPGGKIVDLK
jgi:hypothetical protein